MERGRGTMRIWVVLSCFLCVAGAVSRAQKQQAAPTAQSTVDTSTDNGEEPDVPVVKTATADSGNAESGTDTAWEMLKTALSDSKAQARQARIDAITALGTLSDFEQAQKLLRNTAKDSDRYLRFAAVANRRQQSRAIHSRPENSAQRQCARGKLCRGCRFMEDERPKWRKRFVWCACRRAKGKTGGRWSGLHQADQDLHSPSKLAEIGAEQGAYALLGPVGFGVDAFRMTHKGNNGNSPRVLTATLLADDNSKVTMQQFLDALEDRDSFVRAAAARELGDYRGKQATDALQGAFDDPKPVVRLMAAASYIRASQPVTATQKPHHRNGTANRSSTQER